MGVKAFAAAYQAKFDRLDVLVHNAGSGYFKSSERITEDGLEAFFQTNYLGPFLLTKLFLDLLKSSHGRVVCVSSIEHWEGSFDFEKIAEKTCSKSYATSKLMQMLFAFELQKRHGLVAAAVNPGAVMSRIWWCLRGLKAALWNLVAPFVVVDNSPGMPNNCACSYSSRVLWTNVLYSIQAKKMVPLLQRHDRLLQWTNFRASMPQSIQ